VLLVAVALARPAVVQSQVIQAVLVAVELTELLAVLQLKIARTEPATEMLEAI
jgi:hypothetical protein